MVQAYPAKTAHYYPVTYSSVEFRDRFTWKAPGNLDVPQNT